MAVLKFSDKTLVMGVINTTPDSFSDGGRFDSFEKAFQHAQAMIADGVDIIDIGGVSTRPGAQDISAEKEKERVIPLIQELRECYPDVILSVDGKRYQDGQEIHQALLRDYLAGDVVVLTVAKEEGDTGDRHERDEKQHRADDRPTDHRPSRSKDPTVERSDPGCRWPATAHGR